MASPMPQEKPFFSIVIPVYNKGPHIRRAISSVLNQTFQDFELILINDASTDNSLEEMQQFTDYRIRMLHRDEPGPGGYAARNLGIRKAIADWVAFLDADDEWYPEHLEKLYELSYQFPYAVMLSSGYLIRWNKKLKYYNAYFRFHKDKGPHIVSLSSFLYESTKKRGPAWTSSTSVNKKFALDIFPAGETNKSGDVFAWLFMLTKGNAAWSPHIGAIYHCDSKNMVTKEEIGSPDFVHKIVKIYENYFNKYETKLIKRFANRRIWTAYNFRIKQSGICYFIYNFYWSVEPIYCFLRLTSYLLPQYIVKSVQDLKKRI